MYLGMTVRAVQQQFCNFRQTPASPLVLLLRSLVLDCTCTAVLHLSGLGQQVLRRIDQPDGTSVAATLSIYNEPWHKGLREELPR